MSELSTTFQREVLTSNAVALRIVGKTLEMMLAAKPLGEVITLPDGDPAVRLDDRVLGAPPDEASRRETLTDIAANPDALVVVFGLGVGHAVRQIQERSDATIVVVEPSPGLLKTVLAHGPTDLGGVRVVTDLMQLRATWSSMGRGSSIATIVTASGYDVAFPHELQETTKTVCGLTGTRQRSGSGCEADSRIWLDNAFANLRALEGAVPFLSLAKRFPGVPAFIVGEGPSIHRNGRLLSEAARRGIVFAVDASGKLFVHYEAEPQVLVSVESIDRSEEMRILPWIDRVVRAFSLVSSPRTLATGRGPWLPLHAATKECEAFGSLLRVPGVPMAGGASTAAFSLAERMACNPIVLVGQDLESSRSWFELAADALLAEGPDRQLINASEGDFRIAGFEERVLGELLRALPYRDITAAAIAWEARDARHALTSGDVQGWAREQGQRLRRVTSTARRAHQAARMALATIESEDPMMVGRAFRALARTEANLASACARQHLPEAWACEALQAIGQDNQTPSESRDAQQSARSSLERECELTEAVRRAACDLEKRFQALSEPHGRKAMPRMEKVRCLC